MMMMMVFACVRTSVRSLARGGVSWCHTIIDNKQIGYDSNLHYAFALIIYNRICGIERLSISLPT